jgi:2-phosphosulfolactate phosphatase
LRPSVEDLLGAGAILAALDADAPSPEARSAMAAFEAALPDLAGFVQDSASGRELSERGFGDDVALAVELDVSRCAPVLRERAFVDASGEQIR